MATSVLLAALSILPYEHKDKDRTEADSELEKERSVRMATILGFSVDTKRNARSVVAAQSYSDAFAPSTGRHSYGRCCHTCLEIFAGNADPFNQSINLHFLSLGLIRGASMVHSMIT